MKKILTFFLFFAVQTVSFADVVIDGSSDVQVRKQSVYFIERPTDPSTPTATALKLYAKNNAGTTTLYTKDSTGTVTPLSGGGISLPLAPASGGTGTSTVFTPGSVVFAGTSGVYAEDNSNLFWDNSNNRLGLGTNTPETTLQVLGNSTFSASLGSEIAKPLTSGNWTLLGGWESPIVGTGLNKNADGAGVGQMLGSGISPVVGTTYKIIVTITSLTAGTVYFDFGGFTISGIDISANGTYTYYLIATTTSSFFFHPSFTSRFIVSALSIKALTDNIGDVFIDGNLRVRSKMQDANGVDTLFLNKGFLGVGTSNPVSALTIGSGGDIQLDRDGDILIKNTGGASIRAITMGPTNILSFQNEGSQGEAYYGTSSASISNGNVAIQCKGAFSIFINGGTGNTGLGLTGPTAYLHIKAGTTAASSAPLKFNSGSLMTTAEAGAVEFLTDKFYGTITTGAARKTFAFLESPVLVTPNIGVASGTSLSLSNTVSLVTTGAAATAGTVTLVTGTATVNTTAATSTALIFFQRVTAGGTIGFSTTYTKVNNTSFTISSDNALDTSTYNWQIMETH